MKKLIIGITAVLMVMASSMAFADDGNFKVTVGIKAWNNDWKHTRDNVDGTTNSWDNGSSLMVGPSINFKLGPTFLGVTYLKSQKDYTAPDWYTSVDTMNFERTDTDLTFGVMFVRHFGMFLGYKTIDATMKYTNPNISADNLEVGTWKLKGPGIGFLANASIGDSAAFYGNLAWMKVKQEFDNNAALVAYGIPAGTQDSFDMTGFSIELGFAAAFSDHISGNLGYKYQIFEGDNEFGDTEDHSFKGLTLGFNVTFP